MQHETGRKTAEYGLDTPMHDNDDSICDIHYLINYLFQIK